MQRATIILITLLLPLLLAPTARALDTALSVAPAILETVLDQQTTVTEVTLENQTNFPLPIKGSVHPFLTPETSISDSTTTFDASSWFKLDPPDFILQPNEVKVIKVQITTPQDAEPGGHYATIFFTPMIPKDAVSSATSLARVGILTFLIVPGDIQEQLSLEKFSSPRFRSFGPINLELIVNNTGTIHLLPQIQIDIKNLWGKSVSTLSSPPSTILPGTSKSLTYTWDRHLGLGPYQLQATVSYGTNQAVLNSIPITLWFLPWPLILLSISLLTLCYKLFIVNRNRVVLAYHVLIGKYEKEHSEKTPNFSSHHPRSRAQLNPLRPNPQRRSRRQSNREQNRSL